MASLITGMSVPFRMALTILVGGPDDESNPDTRMLVSTTTRTLSSDLLDFGSEVVWSQRAKPTTGSTEFPHHLCKPSARRFALG